jgi:hypothetical protein
VPEIEKRRKKPLVIEMLLWDGANFPQIDDFAGDDSHGNRNARLFGAGLEVWNDQDQAWLGVVLGHRVAKSTLGELYPMSQQAYDETTEPEPRLSPAELWEKSGGNRDRYRDLLHRHGHLLAPGDEGYDENAPQVPPCGWWPS